MIKYGYTFEDSDDTSETIFVDDANKNKKKSKKSKVNKNVINTEHKKLDPSKNKELK
jgi:hypothetical protein